MFCVVVGVVTTKHEHVKIIARNTSKALHFLEALASLELSSSVSQSVTHALDKLLVWETQLGSELVLPDLD